MTLKHNYNNENICLPYKNDQQTKFNTQLKKWQKQQINLQFTRPTTMHVVWRGRKRAKKCFWTWFGHKHCSTSRSLASGWDPAHRRSTRRRRRRGWAARLVCESISVASYTPQGVYDQHNSRAASAARSHLGQCLMQISVAADTAVVTTVKAQHTLSKLWGLPGGAKPADSGGGSDGMGNP